MSQVYNYFSQNDHWSNHNTKNRFNANRGYIYDSQPSTSNGYTSWPLFNAYSSNSTGVNNPNHRLLKRGAEWLINNKAERDDFFYVPPVKKYISDDKVMQKFQSMNLCENVSPEIEKIESDTDLPQVETIDDDDCVKSVANEDSKVVLCDEMKAYLREDSMVDNIFRGELQKSNQALVLWRPSLLDQFNQPESSADDDNEMEESIESFDIEKIDVEDDDRMDL